MTLGDKNSLKNGNTKHTGRLPNHNHKRLLDIQRMGEDNCTSLYEMQLETARNSPDQQMRNSAQQFLLNKILPNAKSRKLCIDLKPMNTLQDITDNENVVVKSVAEGDITIEEGEKFFGILEHCRKTKEAVVIGEEIQEVKQFIKEHKSKK